MLIIIGELFYCYGNFCEMKWLNRLKIIFMQNFITNREFIDMPSYCKLATRLQLIIDALFPRLAAARLHISLRPSEQ